MFACNFTEKSIDVALCILTRETGSMMNGMDTGSWNMGLEISTKVNGKTTSFVSILTYVNSKMRTETDNRTLETK